MTSHIEFAGKYGAVITRSKTNNSVRRAEGQKLKNSVCRTRCREQTPAPNCLSTLNLTWKTLCFVQVMNATCTVLSTSLFAKNRLLSTKISMRIIYEYLMFTRRCKHTFLIYFLLKKEKKKSGYGN